MDLTIFPGKLHGDIDIIPSKSQAHRLLICAAFADAPTQLLCSQSNADIEATVACLNALGACIKRTESGYHVTPITQMHAKAVLPCGESGSTLRFLLPIVGALGIDGLFHMEGRLPQRPLSTLWDEMERMGCTLTRPSATTLRCVGQLSSGVFSLSGNISSQYISGLLFATALLPGVSQIQIQGKLESEPYVNMTIEALHVFGCSIKDFIVHGGRQLHSPKQLSVEGDWSNGAFFLAANTLGSKINVCGLNQQSCQGDRQVASVLSQLDNHTTISAANIPDLVPILSVVAAAKHGAVFTDVSRLRLKESDRVVTTAAMLNALGIKTESTENTLTVYPGILQSGSVNAANDHRIAMSAAIAATIATGPVTIQGCQCVNKSFPTFWMEYARLGGQYE